jgi:hypothetical protein
VPPHDEEYPVRFPRPALALSAILAILLAGCGADDPKPTAARAAAGTSAAANPPASAAPPVQKAPAAPADLPLGGRTIFPRYRVVAYYGTAGNARLGVLGEAPPEKILPRLLATAQKFRTKDRTIQPAFELIASVAQASPGRDGNYSAMIDMADIQRYVDTARRHKILVILDLQPGRGDFLPQARRLERFLVQPHVGLALDPEWRMPPGTVPARTIGHVDAAEVNRVSAYVAGLVDRHRLPEKLFVLHQFRASMMPDIAKIRKRHGLAMVQHIDGFGTRSQKDDTFAWLRRPQQFHIGYKLFYDEDVNRYAPAEVLRFKPTPELVSYQ